MSAVAIYGVKFKKDLKAKVGESIRDLQVTDPSIFGPSPWQLSGTGEFQVVGPGLYDRKWFASVTIKDNKITKVS